MRFAKARRSNIIPEYLQGVTPPSEERRLAAQAKRDRALREGLEAGRMSLALFEEHVPHSMHRLGMREQLDVPAIWEVQGDTIVRRNDEFVPAMLQAMHSAPDLSEDEYERLMADVRAQYES